MFFLRIVSSSTQLAMSPINGILKVSWCSEREHSDDIRTDTDLRKCLSQCSTYDLDIHAVLSLKICWHVGFQDLIQWIHSIDHRVDRVLSFSQCCGTVTINYGSGSGSDFWKVMVPVPVPVTTFEKLWFRFRFRFLLLKKLRFRFRFQLHI